MKLITQRDLIENITDAWSKQYPQTTGEKALIKNRLIALNKETATAEEVNEIIGNDSWTTITCDECGSQTNLVVRVGTERHYERGTATLCVECITAAYKLATHNY